MPKPDAKTSSLQARMQALRSRHAEIDTHVQAEQQRPQPSLARLRQLKRRKLMLKDEMAYYAGVMRTLSNGHGKTAEQTS